MAEQRDLPDIDSLWNYADPAASERAFVAVLPQARQSNNNDYLAQLLTQLARAQILQRHYDAGHATLDEVIPLLSEKTPIARIRYLLERGRAFNDTNRPAEAKSLFAEAYHLGLASGIDSLAVDAAHMLGVMEPLSDAALWNRRALELAESSPDPAARRWIGTLYINLGSKLQDLHDYAAAEDAFARAISTAQMPLPLGEAGRRPGEGLSPIPTRSVSEGPTSSLSPARVRLARLCLAKNRRLAGDPAAALPLQQQLLSEIDAAGDNHGYSHEEIAECLLALGRPTAAQPHFALAYAALSTYPWFPPTESPRLARIKELAGSKDDL